MRLSWPQLIDCLIANLMLNLGQFGLGMLLSTILAPGASKEIDDSAKERLPALK